MKQETLRKEGVGFQLVAYSANDEYYQRWLKSDLPDWGYGFVFTNATTVDLVFQSIDDAKKVAKIGLVDHYKIYAWSNGWREAVVFTSPDLSELEKESKEIEEKTKIEQQDKLGRMVALASTKQNVLLGEVDAGIVKISWSAKYTVDDSGHKLAYPSISIKDSITVSGRFAEPKTKTFNFMTFETKDGKIRRKEFKRYLDNWFYLEDAMSGAFMDKISEMAKTRREELASIRKA